MTLTAPTMDLILNLWILVARVLDDFITNRHATRQIDRHT